MNRLFSHFAIVAAVATLSGCALTTDKVDISYTPMENVTKIEHAQNVTVSVDVNDVRQVDDKSKVSAKKNAYGMELAPILANTEVTQTFKDALSTEFTARGFTLNDNGADVKFNADITRFWNDFKIGFFAGDAVADLNLSVVVVDSAGKTTYQRSIVVTGKEANIQISGGSNAKKALDMALANGMRTLFDDKSFILALKK